MEDGKEAKKVEVTVEGRSGDSRQAGVWLVTAVALGEVGVGTGRRETETQTQTQTQTDADVG